MARRGDVGDVVGLGDVVGFDPFGVGASDELASAGAAGAVVEGASLVTVEESFGVAEPLWGAVVFDEELEVGVARDG